MLPTRRFERRTDRNKRRNNGIDVGSKRSRFNLRLHDQKYLTGDDLLINPDFFPELCIGDVVEICRADDERKEETKRSMRLFMKVNSLRPLKGTQTELSILTAVADLYKLSAHMMVSVHKSSMHEARVDFVELSLKDQYVSSSEMWLLKLFMSNTSVYLQKPVSMGLVKIKVHELRKGDERVCGGVVTHQTKVTFRSKSVNLFWLVQLSSEMWRHSAEGRLYFELLCEFIRTVWEAWTEADANHTLTVVFFGRVLVHGEHHNVPSVTYTESGCRVMDVYKVIIDKVRSSDISKDPSSFMRKVKKEFLAFPAKIGWTPKIDAASTSAQPSGAKPRFGVQLSSSADGNILEALNLTLNYSDEFRMDRGFPYTGTNIVIMTAGNGVIRVARKLARITKRRMLDIGISCDFISLASPPAHVVPIFVYEKGSANLTRCMSHDCVFRNCRAGNVSNASRAGGAEGRWTSKGINIRVNGEANGGVLDGGAAPEWGSPGHRTVQPETLASATLLRRRMKGARDVGLTIRSNRLGNGAAVGGSAMYGAVGGITADGEVNSGGDESPPGAGESRNYTKLYDVPDHWLHIRFVGASLKPASKVPNDESSRVIMPVLDGSSSAGSVRRSRELDRFHAYDAAAFIALPESAQPSKSGRGAVDAWQQSLTADREGRLGMGCERTPMNRVPLSARGDHSFSFLQSFEDTSLADDYQRRRVKLLHGRQATSVHGGRTGEHSPHRSLMNFMHSRGENGVWHPFHRDMGEFRRLTNTTTSRQRWAHAVPGWNDSLEKLMPSTTLDMLNSIDDSSVWTASSVEGNGPHMSKPHRAGAAPELDELFTSAPDDSFSFTRMWLWKSLVEPAILPLTTDWMPDGSNQEYLQYVHVLSLGRPHLPRQEVLSIVRELVCQRMVMDYQVVIGSSDASFMYHNSRQSHLMDGSPALLSMVGSTAASPLTSASAMALSGTSPKLAALLGALDGASPVVAATSAATTATTSVTPDEQPSPMAVGMTARSSASVAPGSTSCVLAKGRQYHELILRSEGQAVEVIRHVRHDCAKGSPIAYDYLLWSQAYGGFQQKSAMLEHFVEKINWDKLDSVLIGGGGGHGMDEDVSDVSSDMCRKACFVLLAKRKSLGPLRTAAAVATGGDARSAASRSHSAWSTSGTTSPPHSDNKRSKGASFHPHTKSREVDDEDNFVKLMELLTRTSSGVDVSVLREGGVWLPWRRAGVHAGQRRREKVDMQPFRGEPNEWIILCCDALFSLEMCFHIEVEWLVCEGNVAAEYTQMMQRKAKQLGFTILPTPLGFFELKEGPFHSCVELPLSEVQAIVMQEALLGELDFVLDSSTKDYVQYVHVQGGVLVRIVADAKSSGTYKLIYSENTLPEFTEDAALNIFREIRALLHRTRSAHSACGALLELLVDAVTASS